MLSKDILLKSHILYSLLEIIRIIFNILLSLFEARYILEIIDFKNIVIKLKFRDNKYISIFNLI